jgi:lipoprotein-anchoring transpeptidase ErfK/SrfK
VERALQINPFSKHARKAKRWVQDQQRALEKAPARGALLPDQLEFQVAPLEALTQRRLISLKAMLPLLAAALGLGVWFVRQPADAQQPQVASAPLPKASWTPTPTSTSTFTPTPTITPTPTMTSTPTNTPTPTTTPTPRPNISFDFSEDPEELANEERWVDVDIGRQRVTAYEGTKAVRTFIVSTGTTSHPTVTGQFRIWIKLRYDDMAGPGYYLPGVPYTMYFYKGYALHGTYWHDNFGTPMSHGCVNLQISDAEWLFNFASVGTIVNVHP